ncbi:MAG: mechanosensitive ion channel family protein, partial [Leptolyngbyaceae cyanobacterium]
PLTQEQLQVEATEWCTILQNKAQEIAETEIAIAHAEGEAKTELIDQVTELQGEQTGIIDRVNVVLDSLERKGGAPAVYQQYIGAVTSLDLDVTDTQGLSSRLVDWLKSEEGGIRWGLNIIQFLIILAVSAVAARALSKVAETALNRIEAISNLFRGFLVKSTKRAVLIIGFLVALTSLGVSLGPLLAVFGGLSFILAFSLQSNLGNFASGLMLLVYKPFDVGDKVQIPGSPDKGFVRSITLANTSFDHYTGKIITIPNSDVWGSRIEKLLPGDDRLLEFVFPISSNDDARIIKAAWEKASGDHPGILKDKWCMSVPFISPKSGGLMYWCGGWALQKGFWTVYEDIFLSMRDDLQKAGIAFGIDKHESSIHFVSDSQLSSSELLSRLTGSDDINPETDAITSESKTVGQGTEGLVEPDDIDI